MEGFIMAVKCAYLLPSWNMCTFTQTHKHTHTRTQEVSLCYVACLMTKYFSDDSPIHPHSPANFRAGPHLPRQGCGVRRPTVPALIKSSTESKFSQERPSACVLCAQHISTLRNGCFADPIRPSWVMRSNSCRPQKVQKVSSPRSEYLTNYSNVLMRKKC